MKNEKTRCGREFLDWLAGCAGRVKELEAGLQLALGEEGEDAYRGILLDKTRLLAALHEEGGPLLQGLDCLADAERERAGEALAEFSEEAGRALRLNSFFYMSALLYPEDHQPGTPNDLDNFLEEMRRFLA